MLLILHSFFENSLAHMYGPEFLVLYVALYALFMLFVYRQAAELAGTTSLGQDATIPLQPDPYEIAYLRGGETEMLLLAVFGLVKRGYINLLVNDSKTSIKLKAKKTAAAANLLTPYEKEVYLSLKDEPTLSHFIAMAKVQRGMDQHYKSVIDKLQQQHVLWSSRENTRFSLIKNGVVLLMTLLGLYKIFAAISHGHSNVIFLAVLMGAGPFVLNGITRSNRLTSAGIKQLNDLKNTFKSTTGDPLLTQPFLMMQVQLAVHGMWLLNDSKYAHLSDYFSRNIARPEQTNWLTDWNSSSGGGSSCGSSGCGSSSCGSSCGGGCGGGCGGCS